MTEEEKRIKVVEVIEQAQTQIREILLYDLFYNVSLNPKRIAEILATIIDNARQVTEIESLQKDIEKSLIDFARRERAILASLTLSKRTLLWLNRQQSEKAGTQQEPPRTIADELKRQGFTVPTQNYGVPLQKFYDDVYKTKVKPTLDKLVKDTALDPNDITGRNSLRNLAEMEVRYQAHKDDIEELKRNKVKLVLCSTHADCSERCSKYQGRLYSLDGTSGEIDGYKYVPLEYATKNERDVYTTKAGRRYYNGLLGFNCRHKLREYHGGDVPEYVSEKEREIEYAITKVQRIYERQVRELNVKALVTKPFNERESQTYKEQAKQVYTKYQDFCKKNGRAYYKYRINV